jgi:DNA (cytosine-5)-methyltransferase 1
MITRALELYCGIGGFAAAVSGTNVCVAGALDQSPSALSVYRLNFPGHNARQANLETITSRQLESFGADFWWMSPPCQPYTVRGARRDLEDPRALSFIRLMKILEQMPEEALPAHLALENVAGFGASDTRRRLTETLTERGFHFQETFLCPTSLGIPMRRPRYYLAASRKRLIQFRHAVTGRMQPLSQYLNADDDKNVAENLKVPGEVLKTFGSGLRVLDISDPAAYATCFTSGYGRSIMHSGSYLRVRGGVRRFSPEEILQLLHFPQGFYFPGGMPLRKKWQLAGNSLSVAAVRRILDVFPELAKNRRQAGVLGS